MPEVFDLLVLWVSKSQISALGIRAIQGMCESLLLAVPSVYKKLMLGCRVCGLSLDAEDYTFLKGLCCTP